MSKFGGSVDGDEVDQAAILQDNFNKQGIQHSAQQLAPQSHPDFDGVNCVDCGDGMPANRLAMKRIRCTSCQTAIEKSQRHFR